MSTDTKTKADMPYGVPEMMPIRDRAFALKQVLEDKGVMGVDYIDNWKKVFEQDFSPKRGAQIVARAWSDPQFRALLLADGTAAVGQFGYLGPQGEYIVALEDKPGVKNVITCTLCSCTAWPILGLPPTWYKGFEYRARICREPRAVLAEMGTQVPEDVVIKVWDTTAETRYMVLPQRPEGTDGWTEEQLAAIVTKDCLIGVADVKA